MSFGVPVRNGLGLGLRPSTALSTLGVGGRPALLLNFISTTALPSTVTFSRTTQATLTDSTGRLTYAPNNLATNSESFEAATWSKLSAGTASVPVVTANAGISPDGTSTADRIVFDRGSGTTGSDVSYIQHSVTAFTGNAIASIWLKTEDNSTKTIGLRCGIPAAVQITVTGTWQRFSVLSTSASIDRFAVLNYGNYGNSSVTVLAWGAQLEAVTYQTTPGTYNSTTPKNLLGFTQEFDNAAWNKSGATVTANSTAAPDGTTTADALVEDATTGLHLTQQSFAFVSGVPYTVSVYVKAGTRTWAQMLLPSAAFTASQGGFFDLTGAGALGTTNGTPTARTITALADGWYRISVTATATTSASGNVAIVAASANGTTSYAGSNGSTAVSLWGAQLSNSASLDPYVYNPAAAPTSAAFFGPRFDFDPVSLAPRGLLIEEQRTNLFTNSEFPNGVTDAPTRGGLVSGTTFTGLTGTTGLAFGHDGTTSTFAYKAGAATGTTYAISVFVRMDDGGAPAFGSSSTVASDNTFAFVVAGAIPNPTTYTVLNMGGGMYRVSAVATGGAVPANSGIVKYGTNNNRTFKVSGYQLEAGAFATSYIPTVASQVTRTADVASMLGANFSSWYNQTQGTLVVNVSATAGNARAATFSAGAVTNQLWVQGGAVGEASLQVFTAGSFVAQIGLLPANSTKKIAAAYMTNDFAVSIDGGAASTDTSGALGTFDRLNLGARFDGTAGFLNGHVRSITYYPTRLTDAQLQAITA